jgi:hypothetical protein
MTEFKDDLAANARITEPCNHLEATVRLPTDGAKPNFRRVYPIARVHHAIVTEQVRKWLQAGIIVRAPAGCPYNNPLLVVDKKDPTGRKSVEFRVCLDSRLLNKNLRPFKCPLPNVQRIYQHVQGTAVSSTLDLDKSYHQFLKTAFTWDGIQYMFVMAPFGITPVGFEVQYCVADILKDLSVSINYVDDITVCSPDPESHA